MRRLKTVLGLVISFLFLASFVQAENDSLQYFLAKSASSTNELSKKEKEELLNRINEVMEQAWRIRDKLTQAIQRGDMEVQYQEGRFWMSRLEEDREAIETGLEHLKLLREGPVFLVPSIKLFKSLKDLSKNFNAYNNVPFLCAYSDLAPEWNCGLTSFYRKLYSSLAKSKDVLQSPLRKRRSRR
jgi:hypothetical protein